MINSLIFLLIFLININSTIAITKEVTYERLISISAKENDEFMEQFLKTNDKEYLFKILRNITNKKIEDQCIIIRLGLISLIERINDNKTVMRSLTKIYKNNEELEPIVISSSGFWAINSISMKNKHVLDILKQFAANNKDFKTMMNQEYLNFLNYQEAKDNKDQEEMKNYINRYERLECNVLPFKKIS